MAKRKSAEEILQSPFRWPQPDDTPFIAALTPLTNASIADDERRRLRLMILGYKKAADLMVAASEEAPEERDTLVYPIIFNYRQFLELSLKYQLATFGPFVLVEPNWKTHDLVQLWDSFRTILDKYGTNDPDDADTIVGKNVLEFAKIDPDSSSYRYPVDQKGNLIPISQNELHLPTLADVMNGIAGYFAGCDNYLSDMRDAEPFSN